MDPLTIAGVAAVAQGGLNLLNDAFTAFDNAKRVLDEPEVDRPALKQALLDMQDRMISARREYATVLQDLHAIERLQHAQAKRQADLQRYGLSQTAAGATVYALRPGQENGEPPHLLCADCYADDEKSFLQPNPMPGATTLLCHRCKAKVPTRKSDASGRATGGSIETGHDVLDPYGPIV